MIVLVMLTHKVEYSHQSLLNHFLIKNKLKIRGCCLWSLLHRVNPGLKGDPVEIYLNLLGKFHATTSQMNLKKLKHGVGVRVGENIFFHPSPSRC
jgi:hypothetical protein